MQLRVFCILLLFGSLAGALYEPFRLLDGLRGRLRLLKICLDLLFCLFIGAGYLALSLAFCGKLRLFHLFGIAAGIFLYEKSFHKTVAFFGEMVYNAIVRFIQKQKDRAQWKKRNDPSHRKKPRGSP